MLPKITKLKWWLVDKPYNFYCFESVVSEAFHKSQVHRKFIEGQGLTPPEVFAKMMRLELDCEPIQANTRIFDD